jgi:hypothetical protein
MVILGALFRHRLHEFRQFIRRLSGCYVLKPFHWLLASQPAVVNTLHFAFVDSGAFLRGDPERTFALIIGDCLEGFRACSAVQYPTEPAFSLFHAQKSQTTVNFADSRFFASFTSASVGGAFA